MTALAQKDPEAGALTACPASVLETTELTKAFGGLVSVDHVSVSIPHGRITAFIGPNGAGKTTLINLVAGTLGPSSGRVRFDGADITGLSAHQVARRGITRTFQDLRLFARLTVIDNVLASFPDRFGEDPLDLFVRWRMVGRGERAKRQRALEILADMGMSAKADALARDLSYGQQKRLALARALASGGHLVLLDEPASGLDPTAVRDVTEILRAIASDGRTVSLVEHNLQLVVDIADHVVGMSEGRVVVEGTPNEVLAHAGLIAAYLGTR